MFPDIHLFFVSFFLMGTNQSVLKTISINVGNKEFRKLNQILKQAKYLIIKIVNSKSQSDFK